MVVLCQSDAITADQLPDELKDTTDLSSGDTRDKKEMTLKECVEQFEIQLIQKALNNTDSAAKAAKTLGIDASIFVRRGNDMAYNTSGIEKKIILHSPSMVQIFQKANLLAYNQGFCAYLRGKRRWKSFLAE